MGGRVMGIWEQLNLTMSSRELQSLSVCPNAHPNEQGPINMHSTVRPMCFLQKLSSQTPIFTQFQENSISRLSSSCRMCMWQECQQCFLVLGASVLIEMIYFTKILNIYKLPWLYVGGLSSSTRQHCKTLREQAALSHLMWQQPVNHHHPLPDPPCNYHIWLMFSWLSCFGGTRQKLLIFKWALIEGVQIFGDSTPNICFPQGICWLIVAPLANGLLPVHQLSNNVLLKKVELSKNGAYSINYNPLSHLYAVITAHQFTPHSQLKISVFNKYYPHLIGLFRPLFLNIFFYDLKMTNIPKKK